MSSERKYLQLGFDYHWHWARQGAHNPYVRWVNRVLAHLPERGDGLTIVDYGCGDGYPAHLLAGRGFTVIGLDTVAGALEVARQRVPSAAFRLIRDGEPVDLPASDYVLALEVLEHMADPAPLVDVVKRCAQYAIVTSPEPGHDRHAVHGYTLADVTELFDGCTVEIVINEGEHRLFKVTPIRKGTGREDRGDSQPQDAEPRKRAEQQPARSGKRAGRKRA